LFLKLKNTPKGKRFQKMPESVKSAGMELNSILKEEYQKHFSKWQDYRNHQVQYPLSDGNKFDLYDL
jgi:hypothetical protein